MELTVLGLDAAEKPDRFTALFGRYVYGVKPWTHCDRGLISRQETQINPDMKDGTYPIRDELFYLCGVGRKLSNKLYPDDWPRQTNVHLAVRPRKGSVAAIGSVYGVTFVIRDGQAIPITRRDVLLEDGSDPIPEAHANCKMFQFGYQMFDVPPQKFVTGHPATAGPSFHRLREEWWPMQGIAHDSAGLMVDPNRA